MNYPALKGEVSITKMLSQIDPRLRRTDVVFNSFTSCISNTSKELSWAPEMSFPEILSQPVMPFQKFKGGIALKQLECPANAYGCWHLNKDMHVVDSNVQLIDSKSVSLCSFTDEKLTINPYASELERVPSILRLPHEVESILPEGMFSASQIHFFAPTNLTKNPAHAKFGKFSSRGAVAPLHINNSKELNVGDGNSSLGLKAEVSLPLM